MKHGRFAATAQAKRKLVRETIRSARAVLLQAQIEALRPDRTAKPAMYKST